MSCDETLAALPHRHGNAIGGNRLLRNTEGLRRGFRTFQVPAAAKLVTLCYNKHVRRGTWSRYRGWFLLRFQKTSQISLCRSEKSHRYASGGVINVSIRLPLWTSAGPPPQIADWYQWLRTEYTLHTQREQSRCCWQYGNNTTTTNNHLHRHCCKTKDFIS